MYQLLYFVCKLNTINNYFYIPAGSSILFLYMVIIHHDDSHVNNNYMTFYFDQVDIRNVVFALSHFNSLYSDTRIHDCGVPVATSSINLMYNSTCEGSLLKYSCSNGLVPSDLVTSVCTRSMNWYPDPSNHTCSSLSTG